MKWQALRGTTDFFGPALTRWQTVEQTARAIARTYGYSEIRTPVIEDAGLFLRSVGETSDIVQKEMFRFQDRGGHDIVLRPEGTAAVVRAFIEHHLDKTIGFAKLFYLGPMFRAARPQAGRLRQFHQLGAEAIGSESPWVDVEVISLCAHILQACGVNDVTVCLGSMGSREDQAESARRLREALEPDQAGLCRECQARFERNIFRVLDCKNPNCREIVRKRVTDKPFYLSPTSTARYDAVRRGLSEAGVPFDESQAFARGLDYYTHTVFEVRAKGLGAQDAVAAGGRYDRLVEELGGPSVSAIGFAAGIERILMAADAQQGAAAAPEDGRAGIWVAVPKPEGVPVGFRLVQQLRRRGVLATMDYDGASLKAQLREADKRRFRYVVILGEEELRKAVLTMKDLEKRAQEEVPLGTAIETLARAASAKAAAQP